MLACQRTWHAAITRSTRAGPSTTSSSASRRRRSSQRLRGPPPAQSCARQSGRPSRPKRRPDDPWRLGAGDWPRPGARVGTRQRQRSENLRSGFPRRRLTSWPRQNDQWVVRVSQSATHRLLDRSRRRRGGLPPRPPAPPDLPKRPWHACARTGIEPARTVDQVQQFSTSNGLGTIADAELRASEAGSSAVKCAAQSHAVSMTVG